MRRILLLLALLLLPAAAHSQSASSALVSPEAARQVGLERMWFTQLSLDRSRGRVSGVAMHVSAISVHTVFQIVHQGHRYVFSERDRDAFRKEIGVEGAQKAAEEKAKAIQEEMTKLGKADAAAPTTEKFVVPK